MATSMAQKRGGDRERPNSSPSLSNGVLIATLLASPAQIRVFCSFSPMSKLAPISRR